MTDNGVETVLLEIKERVRAEHARGAFNHNHAADSQIRTAVSDPLARLRANLAVTERTWSKLPPIASYHRQGTAARLEVWVKRQIKRVSDWYFHEQVNFNSAVHGALQSTASVLDQSLTEQRVCLKQLALQMSEQQVVLDRARRAIDLRIDELAAKVEELRCLRVEVEQSRGSA